MRNLVIVLLSTGLKLSEVLSLSIHNMDESAMTLQIGVGNRRRTVPINEAVKAIFLKKKDDKRIFKIQASEVEYQCPKRGKLLVLKKTKLF